jgi:hypothetical protein
MPDDRVALLREVVLAVVLAVAAVAITVGAAMLLPAVGWIVGGVVAAVWAVRVL